ncbi:metal ABC transporter solute-binding protein, Zn/Mn family [Saccharomonospora cyanea]|uniref:ABC-type metal ion transport system, periplasmic component/surface adhesin n=1 Tax=Saccharomonospora cyanea NA-134 TaxID=882082 RepID=H5XD39_9PSEU|nr:zinc ABC transporter substrate-binding protein [Saccharomonospora cyanea]EHR63470.1 ABC-type metal ion transport system, periplasmic component/surface adhesin [Saccharomonospora cyanea NA-134]
MHDTRRRSVAGVSLSAVLAVLVAACGGQDGAAQSEDGRIQVVASTNVWASVVAAVGGEHVEVTSIIEDPSADPHSYQAGAADAAEVASAELLVWNGGGYDDFFPQLAENSDAPTVVAVDQAQGRPEEGAEAHEHAEPEGHGHSHEHGHEHGNEHVWYDLPVVAGVADRLAAELGELLPQQKKVFEDNAADFTESIDELVHEVEGVAERHAGAKVAATEPLAQYLLSAAELEDITPHEFASAVENETDVPVAAQQRMLELVSGEADAVVRNTQTATPATEKIVEAAREAGTPVVDVTETLPEGRSDYISWMGAQVDALAKALDE